jgi:cyclophilin family peptidyl-prolyl cis-trans isomerase
LPPVPTQKRERKRQGRQVRQEYLQSQRRKAKLRRQAIVVAVVVALVLGATLLFSRGGDNSTASKSSTSTTAQAKAAFGTTACPPAGGSGERKTAFEAPFKKCIDEKKAYTATMETDAGVIEIALFADRAPVTVNNFVALARHHFFDGVPFHRVIPDFVLQGGDAEKQDGTGGPGYTFGDELPQPGDYKEGSLAMANSGPGTNGSQFFIVTSAKGAEALVQAVGGKANYSLFGQVTKGIDVVKRIEADGDPSGTPKVVHKMVRVTIAES